MTPPSATPHFPQPIAPKICRNDYVIDIYPCAKINKNRFSCFVSTHARLCVPSVYSAIFHYNFLTERCNFVVMFGYCHDLLFVCLSVTGIYSDKMVKDWIMRFSLKCTPVPYSLPTKFDDKIRRVVGLVAVVKFLIKTLSNAK